MRGLFNETTILRSDGSTGNRMLVPTRWLQRRVLTDYNNDHGNQHELPNGRYSDGTERGCSTISNVVVNSTDVDQSDIDGERERCDGPSGAVGDERRAESRAAAGD